MGDGPFVGRCAGCVVCGGPTRNSGHQDPGKHFDLGGPLSGPRAEDSTAPRVLADSCSMIINDILLCFCRRCTHSASLASAIWLSCHGSCRSWRAHRSTVWYTIKTPSSMPLRRSSAFSTHPRRSSTTQQNRRTDCATRVERTPRVPIDTCGHGTLTLSTIWSTWALPCDELLGHSVRPFVAIRD